MGDVPALGQHTDAILEELGVAREHDRGVAEGGSDLMAIKQGGPGACSRTSTVGDVYEHPLGRTILDADNVWFTLPDDEHEPDSFRRASTPAQTEFKKPLVNSCFTLALVTGQSVTDLTMNAVANLGWDEVRLPQPALRRRHGLLAAARCSRRANRNRARTSASSGSRRLA